METNTVNHFEFCHPLVIITSITQHSSERSTFRNILTNSRQVVQDMGNSNIQSHVCATGRQTKSEIVLNCTHVSIPLERLTEEPVTKHKRAKLILCHIANHLNEIVKNAVLVGCQANRLNDKLNHFVLCSTQGYIQAPQIDNTLQVPECMIVL